VSIQLSKPLLRYTLAGLLAIILWSLASVVTRGSSEQIGAVLAGAIIYLSGGIAGLCLHPTATYHMLASVSWRVAVILFFYVTDVLAFTLCIGLALTQRSAVDVTLINYLWPALTVIFTIVVFKQPTNSKVWLALMMALSGLMIALDPEISGFSDRMAASPAVYALGVWAAVSWALYCVFSRKYADHIKGNMSAVAFICVGSVLAAAYLAQPSATLPAVEHLWLPTCLGVGLIIAYTAWDYAIRLGNYKLIVNLSFFIPILSTVLYWPVFDIVPTATFWIGVALLCVGSRWMYQQSEQLARPTDSNC
jgi:drug/metabolite transporter (DMT)-like permease